MEREALERDVRQLLSIVPRNPDRQVAGGADDDELADLERRLNRSLPGELIDWLRVCKGEAIGPGGLYGARPDVSHLDMAEELNHHNNWRTRGWLPVAGDGCGNAYVLITERGSTGGVGFVDTMTDVDAIDYIVASDLWHFLRFLLLRETGHQGWPFDRQAVVAADPGMAEMPSPLLPWHEA